MLRALVVLVIATCSVPAWANGQSAHLWITEEAVTRVPEGPLRELLEDPALRQMLRNGTMFPDGGYPLGDDYAELAHWEPLQFAYMDWIRATYSEPWSAEAREHIAFLLGMASHGMADQFHDALYMERARQYDAEQDWSQSMDQATDVKWAWLTIAQEVTPEWIPTDPLVAIYRDHANHHVTAERLKEGQGLLRAAVWWVGSAGQDWQMVALHEDQFPWATSHLEDPVARGNPADEADMIARYWEFIWERLHGASAPSSPVIATIPADNGFGHTSDAALVESRITIVFTRGLDAQALSPANFRIKGPDGDVPFTLDLFYGHTCHVLHLMLDEDLLPDADYEVTVQPGVLAWDGTALDGHAFRFSTRSPPPPAEASPQNTKPASGCPNTAAPPVLGSWAVLVFLRRRR